MAITKLHRFHYNSDRIRGSIIAWTINLERAMDNYICRYFLEDKKKRFELMELFVSDRMQFKDKADALVQIVSKNCMKEGKVFKKEYPRMAKELEEIAKTRNIFAHNMTVPNPHHLAMDKYAIILFKFKDKGASINYTMEDIDKITAQLHKYLKIIDILNGEGTAIPSV